MGITVAIPGTSLKRDIHSKALTETNYKGQQEYNVKKKMLKAAKAMENVPEEINMLKDRITALEYQIEELKKKKDSN